jgi:hypothetical protein
MTAAADGASAELSVRPLAVAGHSGPALARSLHGLADQPRWNVATHAGVGV